MREKILSKKIAENPKMASPEHQQRKQSVSDGSLRLYYIFCVQKFKKTRIKNRSKSLHETVTDSNPCLNQEYIHTSQSRRIREKRVLQGF
jgi:hypothetical protein